MNNKNNPHTQRPDDYKDNSNNDFKLSKEIKVFMALFLLFLTLIIVVLFLVKGRGGKAGDEPAIEDEQVSIAEDEKDEEVSQSGGKIDSIKDAANSIVGLIEDPTGMNMTEPFERGEDLLEDSYIYYEGEAYKWHPGLKIFTPNYLMGDRIGNPNLFGRIRSKVRITSALPEEMNEIDYELLNENNQIGIYQPPVSDYLISHVEIVDDNTLVLMLDSKDDFDYLVFLKDDSRVKDKGIKDYIGESEKVYALQGSVDKKMTERLSIPRQVNHQLLNKSPINQVSRQNIDSMFERVDASVSYIAFNEGDEEGYLYRLYLLLDIGDSVIIVDMFDEDEPAYKIDVSIEELFE